MGSNVRGPGVGVVRRVGGTRTSPTVVELKAKRLSPSLLPDGGVKRVLRVSARRSLSLKCVRSGKDLSLHGAIDTCLEAGKVRTSPRSVLVISKKLRTLRLVSVKILGENSAVLRRSPSCLGSMRIFRSTKVGLLNVPLSGRKVGDSSVKHVGQRRRTTVLCAVPAFRGPANALVSRGEQLRLVGIYRERSLPVVRSSICNSL